MNESVHNGQPYVVMRALVTAMGLDWRSWKSQRVGIETGDNAILYGSRRLISPVFNAVLGGLKPSTNTATDAGDPEKVTQNQPSDPTSRTDLCIRLDRAQMFLARVNTNRVRSNGNIDAANYLLALQIEWAQALDAYQLHGVAVKQEVRVELKTLGDLLKMREQATQYEKPGLTKLIANAMRELGCTVEIDRQASLPLEGGAS